MGFQPSNQNDLVRSGLDTESLTDPASPTCPDQIIVKVSARNDHGDQRWVTGVGRDTNDAVRDAIDRLIDDTGDDSWCMSDWRPA